MMHTKLSTVVKAVSLRYTVPFVLLLVTVYWTGIHPWLMNWGTTEAEQRMALPGDEVAGGPVTSFTRAITINAPADQTWPWLVQIGQDRAGFYSNDWLENIIAADIHNANAIHPEWQQRQLSDVVRLVPDGYLGGLAGRLIVGQSDAAIGPRIWLLQPKRAIADTPGRFVLIPIDNHTTRLLLRESIEANTPGGGAFGVVAGGLVWDPAHFVMVQRMLRGIKERAERRPETPVVVTTIAQLGWVGAGIAVAGLFVSQRRRHAWLVLPVVAAMPARLMARDVQAGLAVFIAVGITLLGFLIFGKSWWGSLLVIASVVLLTLLLTPDAYIAIGLAFALLLVAVSVVVAGRSSTLGGGARWTAMPTR